MTSKLSYTFLSIALSAAVMNATAQKVYTEGMVTSKRSMGGQDVEVMTYFTLDSIAVTFTQGPAKITILSDANFRSSAILLDVATAKIKKAAILTPEEIDQAKRATPNFAFERSTETKQISGFNCIKVVATDANDKKTYDIWITNDIHVPGSAFPPYYKEIGGFPVQYTTFQQGQRADVTVQSVIFQKAPAGTFDIAPDFDKITLSDLKAMTGGN